MTGITYPSGTYAAVTPAKTFIYGAATVDGQAMPNAAGRLAEAYTGPVGAKITGEGFGYDSMGRPTDLYEMAPGSNGYYHSAETYWLDGQVETLSIPGVPVITYTPNAVGEVAAVSAASGQNPVTGATYNPAGKLLTMTYGSGDADGYAYYADTGLMQQYQFTVNGQTDTGNLAWNPDGTLQSLDIADNISGAGDTQNCTYSHDDLGRISEVACGSLWQQTFSLDAFGNLKTSGSVSWQPSYDEQTNQANLTYDADGDLTGGSFHAYTWNAAGELASVDGSPAVYDALGRRVETGTNWQWLYPPGGGAALAYRQAQTGGWGRAPLPGGAWAVYNGPNLWFYRHGDWPGTDRLATEPNHAIWSAEAYAPYGDAYAATNQDWSFTGHDPDYTRSATGSLYDFPFREYQPTQGRWLSPDPAGLAAVNPANPQTWNAYAYVGNQPLEFTDPLGLTCAMSNNGWVDVGPGGCSQADVNPDSSIEPQEFTVAGGPSPELPVYLFVMLGDLTWSSNCGCAQFSRIRLALSPSLGQNYGAAIRAAADGEPDPAPGGSPATAPARFRPGRWTRGFVCKASAGARVLSSMEQGAALGFLRGAGAGFLGGELLEPLGGGLPGALGGAFVGGVVGASGGVFQGAAVAAACSAAGAY